MSASLNGIPEAFEKPIAAGVPRVGDADDEVRLGRRLAREALAHAHARTVHLDAADPRVRTREVDVLEDAERVPARRERACAACSPSSSTQTTSPGRTSRTTSAPIEVERAGLGRDDPVVADPAERERAEAERVAERDEHVVDERGHRVRALEPPHRVRDRLGERSGVARDERRDHLGVRARRRA